MTPVVLGSSVSILAILVHSKRAETSAEGKWCPISKRPFLKATRPEASLKFKNHPSPCFTKEPPAIKRGDKGASK